MKETTSFHYCSLKFIVTSATADHAGNHPDGGRRDPSRWRLLAVTLILFVIDERKGGPMSLRDSGFEATSETV
jgi:hypothetical protein